MSERQARTDVRRLAEANQELRWYAVQVEELAITKERNRLVREIHDVRDRTQAALKSKNLGLI